MLPLLLLSLLLLFVLLLLVMAPGGLGRALPCLLLKGRPPATRTGCFERVRLRDGGRLLDAPGLLPGQQGLAAPHAAQPAREAAQRVRESVSGREHRGLIRTVQEAAAVREINSIIQQPVGDTMNVPGNT